MSWEQLRNILTQNREEADLEAREPPDMCPYDGARLDVRADGIRNCPMGNFTWRGGKKPQIG